MKLLLELIDPNPRQPRKRFDGLEALAASIKDKGLLEPIMVRPIGQRYEIILGERRYRACRLAGLSDIECIIRDMDDKESYEIALIENIQRQDLTPMEEAQAYKTMQEQGHTQAAIAATIGKDQSYIAHKIKLLRLPAALTHYLQQGILTENHIRQVEKLKGIYGADLLSQRYDESFCSDTIATPEAAFSFLLGARPEDDISLVILSMEPKPVIVEACRLFADYVSKHNGQVKQWEVAAFWWASMAVVMKMSVVQLSEFIELWQERYEAAFYYFNSFPECPEKGAKLVGSEDEEEGTEITADELWWGYWADLKHSASLGRRNDPEAWGKGLMRIYKHGYWVFPSKWNHAVNAKLDSLTEELDKAETLPEVLAVANAAGDLQNECSEYTVRAQRAVGKIIQEYPAILKK